MLFRSQIVQKNDSLQSHKVTKVEVVKQKQTEAQKLTKDEKNVKGVLTDLQKKEIKLRADLKIQQKKANDLNNKIERMIAEEIRKAEAKRLAAENSRIAAENKRIAAENKLIAAQNKRIDADNKAKATANASAKNTPKTTAKIESIPKSEPKPIIKEIAAIAEVKPTTALSVSVLTKEETLLSGDFQRNIGRLPWPTSNGFIRGRFGVQPHPVLKFVTTNNKGIYIQTPSGSSARAVFEGIVTQRFSIPGSNNGVIIKHGNYRTVYANLTQVFVKEGDHVSAKQAIGKIYTDDENDNKTELYFQVYNGRNVQNPENWIAK